MHGAYYQMENKRPLPLRWTAPEVLVTQKYSPATDVYSFGMLIYEASCARTRACARAHVWVCARAGDRQVCAQVLSTVIVVVTGTAARRHR